MGTKESAWRLLADDIEKKASAGVWRRDERLPSLREVKASSGRSMNTVVRAFRELEDRGVLEARDRSGYYLKAVPGSFDPPRRPSLLAEAEEVEVNALIETVVADSRDPSMVPMGASVVDPALLPVKALNRIVRGLSPDEWVAACSYAPSAGLESFRRRLAAYYLGLIPGVAPDNFVVTAGGAEAVSLALMAIVAPPAVVVVESPTHFGTLQMLRDRGYRVLELPIDPRRGIDPDDLKGVFQRKPPAACLLTPTVHNPTGATMDDERKRTIVELLARFGVPAVEDEVYAETVYRGDRPRPLAHWAERSGATVVTCSSFSKVIAPGFRVGWAVGATSVVREITRLKAGLSLAAATLQQEILARYIAGSAFERHLHRLRSRVKTQVYAYAHEIAVTFPKGTRLALPEGGNFLWIELPERFGAVGLHKEAREVGIVIVPGPAFSATGRYGNFLRISAPAPLDDRFRGAIATLGRLLEGG